jgi:hypothetical protein
MSPFSALSPETIAAELEYRRAVLAVSSSRRPRRLRRAAR